MKIAAHHLNKRGGVIIGDVVGLGKTMMATALARVFEDDYDMETLIICRPISFPCGTTVKTTACGNLVLAVEQSPKLGNSATACSLSIKSGCKTAKERMPRHSNICKRQQVHIAQLRTTRP
ncbi:MAG: hypothetical protein ACYYK0_02790 [Candidatus Eutrophobiaceae bacterium]